MNYYTLARYCFHGMHQEIEEMLLKSTEYVNILHDDNDLIYHAARSGYPEALWILIEYYEREHLDGVDHESIEYRVANKILIDSLFNVLKNIINELENEIIDVFVQCIPDLIIKETHDDSKSTDDNSYFEDWDDKKFDELQSQLIEAFEQFLLNGPSIEGDYCKELEMAYHAIPQHNVLSSFKVQRCYKNLLLEERISPQTSLASLYNSGFKAEIECNDTILEVSRFTLEDNDGASSFYTPISVLNFNLGSEDFPCDSGEASLPSNTAPLLGELNITLD